MSGDPVRWTREDVHAFDRAAWDEFGIPGMVLMENAGRGCVDVLLQQGVREPVAVCCGLGNNGGDGFVIARWLSGLGIRASVLLAGTSDRLRGDALANFEIARRGGVEIVEAPQPSDWEAYAGLLRAADWIVDALLGVGFAGSPRPPYDRAIELINAAGRPVLAVDVPSGLDANLGTTPGVCVQASTTVTFVAEKAGLATSRGRDVAGRVHVAPLGAPHNLLTRFGIG